jgi:Na+-driven multidrug efflux pump
MAAAEKYFGLITLLGGALDGAFASYSAQNYGAGRMDRIRAGLRCCVGLSMAGTAATAAVLLAFGRQLLGLLIAGDPGELEQILAAGYEYLAVLALTVPLMFLLCLYRSGLEGMGSTFASTLSGFVELGLRLAAVLLLPGALGRWAIYLANPLGWLGAAILLACSYYRVFRRRTRELANQ